VAFVLLKLVLTPLLIGAASLAGRRWGAFIGGWLIALPLTSGPVTFFIALEQGPSFAADVAAGSLLGVAAIAAFAAAYAWLAGPVGWPAAVTGAAGAFFAVGLAGQPMVGQPVVILLALVLASLLLAGRALPHPVSDGPAEAWPGWEIPARMVIGTAIVLALTAAAQALGPGLSGVVAIFPTFTAILVVFTQRREGPAQALAVLRGLLAGLYGTAGFFVILIVWLAPLGVAGGFGLALAGSAVIQAVVLLARRFPGRQRARATPSITAR